MSVLIHYSQDFSKLNLSHLLISFNGTPEFLDSGRKSWTLESGRWTLDAGRWPLDADFKDDPDIMLSELVCFSETKRYFNYTKPKTGLSVSLLPGNTTQRNTT